MTYVRPRGFQAFHIEPELKEALKERAARDERSVSALIRIYVRRGLEADGVHIRAAEEATK